MLCWYEADSGQEKRRAPLVLIPVELERATAKERFHLNYTGEEIGVNLSLAAKLKSEFGIDLPLLNIWSVPLNGTDLRSCLRKLFLNAQRSPLFKENVKHMV